MPSAHLHPEFGYLCPSRGLRRAVRVFCVLAMIGSIAGASGVATLMADHKADVDFAAMALRLDGVDRIAVPASLARPDAAPKATAGADRGKAAEVTAIEAGDRDDAAHRLAVALEAARVGSAKSARAAADRAGPACDASAGANAGVDTGIGTGIGIGIGTWAYLDGKCVAAKPRQVRVARTQPATAVSASAAAQSPRPRTLAKPAQSPPQRTPAAAVAAQPSPRTSVATATLQRAAAGQSRPGDRPAGPSRQDVRAGPFGPDGFAIGPFGPGGLFSLFR